MTTQQIVVAVMQGGVEYYEEVVCPLPRIMWSNICKRAVSHAKLTTSRANPVAVKVTLLRLVVDGGDLTRELISEHEVTPPFAEMKTSEYERVVASSLNDLSPEFRALAQQLIDERHRRYGYEAAVSFAKSFTGSLRECISNFCVATIRSWQP